ncbi:MAG: bile acid:sodium symporter [Reyranella sp.]|uniref:bile acid:sodium symporter family protein n=1 Tax=Reyranella sp. TaxID=1929291 RepID=UPI001ACF26AE|nr:bile acid:sodium symporter family protein [Reyranella sp.]MBN9086537.1 bile acid:sodium symporter [Reyranella sp.]
MRTLARFLPDGFTLAILAIVVLGAFLPCGGEAARWVGIASKIAIGLLFFLQGARLSRAAVLAGILHWRLHLMIFSSTFVVFPLLGLALGPVSGTLIAAPLYVGVLFLCCLPSTVQASVIFTSIAGGNVAAALCSASLSSIIGVVLTPLLVGLLLHAHGEASVNGVVSIALQLLPPFIAGQVLQRWLEPWMKRNQKTVRRVDLGSVLLMVYGAISAATLSGMWRLLPVQSFLALVLVDGVLLAVMLSFNVFTARRLRFTREDQIPIAFCGTQKSLIMGIPMANALFAGSTLGFVVLPMIVYHQMQFMACAALARRYAARERQRVLAVGAGEGA